MLSASSVQPCVESGAVNFVNSEPVLGVAESRQLAILQLFNDPGATFYYCNVPDENSRTENEPFFTFTKHRVVKFDPDTDTVHAVTVWSSVTNIRDGDDKPEARFRYHPVTRQWLKLLPGTFDFAESGTGYIIPQPVGSVPATPLIRRQQ